MTGERTGSGDEEGRGRPLAGVTVVEMANVITGPFAGMILADLGADVVKVEAPDGGDPFRSWEASGARVRPSFAAFNRGKRSVVLDVKKEQGRDLYRRLVAGADAVIENFRPGRLAKLGIGAHDMRALNPGLVYCYVSGVGSTGPDRDRPTYDAVAQALSGLWSQFTDLAAPEPVGPPMGDQLAGVFAAVAILAALARRQRTGQGELVEVDMLSACLAFSGQAVASATWQGDVPAKTSRARNSQSYAFVAKDGLPFAVHLSTPRKFWSGLCTVVGRPELVADERFATKAQRIRHYDELHGILTGLFAGETRDFWLEQLAVADVPAAPILTLPEALRTDQVRAKEIVSWDVEGNGRGLVRSPVVIGGRHCAATRVPPDLGAHTDEVLAELGIPSARLAELRGADVIA